MSAAKGKMSIQPDDMRCFRLEDFELSASDQMKLKKLHVPTPNNEIKRINVLRQSNLLDSFNIDESYDRYTNLAARIFKAPICLISLVDVDRQWFKSRIGLEATETHRDSAFCAYTVLEDTPDVFVVLDALKDPRFKSNPLVVGPPFIRFYAGAALFVEEVKLGSFCIIDSAPKDSFDLKMQMSLMDIASIVANMIATRRAKMLDIESDLARLSMSIVYALKFPLQDMTNMSEKLAVISERANSAFKSSSCDDPNELKKLVDDFYASVADFCNCISQQKMLSESSLALGQSFVNYEHQGGGAAADMRKLIQFEKVNMVQFLQSMKESVQKVHPQIAFDMSLNVKTFAQSAYQLSYPDLIQLIMFSAVFNIVKDSNALSLSVLFVESASEGLDEAAGEEGEDLEQQLAAEGLELMRGKLVLLFSSQSEKSLRALVAERDSTGIADYGSFDMGVFDSILRCIGASYKVFVSSKPTTNRRSSFSAIICHELSFPCHLPIPKRRVAQPLDMAREQTGGMQLSEALLSPASRTLRVLLVEDSASLQKLLARWLKARDCEVMVAGNGKEALNLLKSDRHFDVLLLDFLLPVMLGLACLKEFSRWKGGKVGDTLIVGLSATASDADQDRAFQYGMHFYCAKPANTDIMTLILRHMKEARSLQAAVAAITQDTADFKTGIRHAPIHR